jgi:transcriptional regulator with XRE-family HTH domain
MPSASPAYGGHPALKALGAAIQRARKAQDISQEDLADKADLDRAYLSSIERGGQNAGVMLLLRIAQALDITLAELVGSAGL